MGHWSEKQIEMTEGGMSLWKAAELSVCPECFADEALKAVVLAATSDTKCDFCGAATANGGPIAARLDHIVRHMLLCIEREWEAADGALPFDKEEDKYLLEHTHDTNELLDLIDFEVIGDGADRLRDEIVGALPEQQWCRRSPLIPQPHEAIANSWRTFCHVIKHERRFYFLNHENAELAAEVEDETAAYTIPELLDAVAAYAQRAGLFVVKDAGTTYRRAQTRHDPTAPAFGPRRMGPPPLDKATQPNRMSPAGIPMFYGAEDSATSLREIAHHAGAFAIGVFEALRPLHLLDLRLAPALPSLFDDQADDRPFALFMKGFIADFQKPISAGAEVDYVPTQVVTEYFRGIVRHEEQAIDGILYASTRHEGGTAVVLFADTESVEDTDDPAELHESQPWLRIVGYEECVFDPASAPQAVNS